MLRFFLTCIVLFAACANGQVTTTTTDANGQTIVQVVTLNPQGLPTTQIIQTLAPNPVTPVTPVVPSPPATPGAATTTTTTPPTTPTPTTTTPDGQQGPVGQPAPTVTLPNGVTPYVYTTVINGVTSEISDNFTPTHPPTVIPTIASTGTIMDYSEWLSIYGPKSSAVAAAANSGAKVGSGKQEWWGIMGSTAVVFAGSVWLLF